MDRNSERGDVCMKKINSQEILRQAFARMSLAQLKETKKSLSEQLEVLDNLIAEQERSEVSDNG